MALKIGNNAVTGAYLGANQVRRAYKGGTLVFQAFGPATEQEFIQQEATGGPAQLLKVYGKTIVDAGSLQSNKTSLLRAERVPIINIWDEEWESGTIDSSTGANAPNITTIRAKNYIPVLPDTQYYIEADNYSGLVRMRFYDENKAYIGYGGQVLSSGAFTTPTGGYYMRITINDTTTYSHDICINLSDPAINGQYFPHWRGSLALNLSTLTSGGVVVYPDGLRGVGTDRDEAYGSTAIVRMGRVDLGTLYWTAFSGVPNAFTASVPGKAFGLTNFVQSKYTLTTDTVANMPDKTIKGNNSGTPIYVKDTAYPDAATFKAAMSGVMLDYPLATPQTYTMDTPLPTDLTCEQGDILQRVSDNNCPFVGEMKFGL